MGLTGGIPPKKFSNRNVKRMPGHKVKALCSQNNIRIPKYHNRLPNRTRLYLRSIRGVSLVKGSTKISGKLNDTIMVELGVNDEL